MSQDNENLSIGIGIAGFCIMLGMACLATHSADPLWGMFLLVFVFLAL